MTRKNIWVGIALSLAVPLVVLASNLVTPNMFTPGTSISSAQVNANFAAVQTAVNNRPDVYGDGSAGSLTLSANTDWRVPASVPPQANLQFTNLTIGAGVTLTVPSGLVIQVTGTFTNQGTIAVDTYAVGGTMEITPGSTGDGATRSPAVGISRGSASLGERAVGAGVSVEGGSAGVGIQSTLTESTLLKPGPNGGGGGAGCLSGATGSSGGTGGRGGGTLVIVAGGALASSGTINANGENAIFAGGGGGGGGVIVLASKTSVSNTGTLSARGGNGGASGVSNGAGGGGGGGLIQLIAPAVTNTGTTTLTFGNIGTVGAVGSASATGSRQGGGGGGASAGSGMAGGGLSGNSPLATAGGQGGDLLVRQLDPTSLL